MQGLTLSNGGTKLIEITYRNPLNKQDTLTVSVNVNSSPIAEAWQQALKELLQNGNHLEKNFCFLGWAGNQRDLNYLCQQLNQAIHCINRFNEWGVWQRNGLEDYQIEEWFAPDVVRFGTEYTVAHGGRQRYKVGLQLKHGIMNRLHNHFEMLQGTVENLSPYYRLANDSTKYAIRQLNNLCHEIESLVLSQRKRHSQPEWQRPSQITTWLGARRYDLSSQHRADFIRNGYDRRFGYLYMHWTQIGKTLIEVFRDENAPKLTDTVCDAITHLQYYSGEFDIEWGRDVVENSAQPWHDQEQQAFRAWLVDNGLDPTNPELSLGYLELGHIDLIKSFGTTDVESIWAQLETRLDIYKIRVGDVEQVYDYCWSDTDYQINQMQALQPGYDYQKEHAK